MTERNFLYPEVSENNPIYGIKRTDLTQEVLDSIFTLWQETVGGYADHYLGTRRDDIVRAMLSGERAIDFRCGSYSGINAKLYVISSGSTKDNYHVLRFAYFPNDDSEGEEAEVVADLFNIKVGSYLLRNGYAVKLKKGGDEGFEPCVPTNSDQSD